MVALLLMATGKSKKNWFGLPIEKQSRQLHVHIYIDSHGRDENNIMPCYIYRVGNMKKEACALYLAGCLQTSGLSWIMIMVSFFLAF